MSFRNKLIIVALIILAFLAGYLFSLKGTKKPESRTQPDVKVEASAGTGPVQPISSPAPAAPATPPAPAKKHKKIERPSFPQFQKGITYVTWDRVAYSKGFSDLSMSRLSSLGCQYIAIVTTWYQNDYNSTEIRAGAYTPTDESLAHAIRQAHDLGLKVMLKPHLDLVKSGYWRGEVQFNNDADWEAWFKSYGNFIVHYAALAEENGVELFCVGVELTAPATYKGELWDKYVISEVRKVYTGPITYAANWNEEYQNITFWDKLDYAGLDAYFPLSDKDKPTIDDLREGWKKYMPEIEAWQKRINKPVVLTEVGYKSSSGAAKAPWEHQLGREVDLQL
ncbi:MAG: glycoside hydrolase TIM-barrel-like domain-containing protein [Candidatus Omnitrophica bacterium]|nr:glycoside hydrolase TIM-barrel-like domain-containing protein [Candidatus Omnitrophota bacterium]